MPVAAVEPTKQQQVPGTEPEVSEELAEKHLRYAIAKYQAKAAQEEMRKLKDDIVVLMREEGIDALSVEIDVGDERRLCKTQCVEDFKLKSELEKVEQEG